MAISNEQPPDTTDTELAEYLSRRFGEVGSALDIPARYVPRKVPPNKLRRGDVFYFGEPGDNDYDPEITAQGLWVYTAFGWQRLDNRTLDAVVSVAGYGGGRQAVPIPDFDIPTTGYRALPFDVLAPDDTSNVEFHPDQDNFHFLLPGPWMLIINITLLGHNSGPPNDAREFTMQLYDQTADIVLFSTIVAVGRSSEDTADSRSVIAHVPKASVDAGDLYQIRVGDASGTIDGGTLIQSMVQVNYIGNISEALGP